MLTKKVKIELNYSQELILNTLSNEHRLLYNHLLGYIKETKNTEFNNLNQIYKQYFNENKLTIKSKSAQNTCRNLINSIKSFYVKRKVDKTAKFPYKFKSWKYFTSFTLDQYKNQYGDYGGGFSIENNKLILNIEHKSKNSKKLIIELNNYVSDINNENIKIITFSKDDNSNEYFISFVYQEESKKQKLDKNNFLGIDLGYTNLVSGITKKENIKISNYKQKNLIKDIETVQSKRDTKNKGSRRHKKLAKTYRRLNRKKLNKQKDFQHKTSKLLTEYCVSNDIGKVIIGDMNVKSVLKNKIKEYKDCIKLAKKTNNDQMLIKFQELLNKEYEKEHLNKDSKSTAVSRFTNYLQYKMVNKGIEFILQNEAFTSKINCLTGLKEFDSSIDKRFHEYNGMKIDRDINSCINITTKSGIYLTQDEKLHLLNNKVSNLYCY